MRHFLARVRPRSFTLDVAQNRCQREIDRRQNADKFYLEEGMQLRGAERPAAVCEEQRGAC